MVIYRIFISVLSIILLVYVFLIYYHNNIAIKPIRKKYTVAYIFLWILELLILFWFILAFIPLAWNKTSKLEKNDVELKKNIDEAKHDNENKSSEDSYKNNIEIKDKWWFSTIMSNEFGISNEDKNNPLVFSEDNCERWVVDRIKDWDTIVVNWETIRLIWINTPETVYPDKPVECFWKEASERLKKMVSNKRVCLIKDSISDDIDKYWRKLRYIYLESWKSVNETMLEEWYSREYSKYDFWLRDKYQDIANQAMKNWEWIYKCPVVIEDNEVLEDQKMIIDDDFINEVSKNSEAEHFSEYVIDDLTQEKPINKSDCNIKWNINYNGEKIYHVPWCENYNDTIISTSKWERWFCTEEEAKLAWRRKARNC